MNNLARIIDIKFPTVNFLTDVIIQDDGNGPYIKEWNLPGDMPDQAQLYEWEEEVQEALKFKNNKIANQTIYEQLDAIDFKSIRALRSNDTVRLASLEQEAIALRAQLLPVE